MMTDQSKIKPGSTIAELFVALMVLGIIGGFMPQETWYFFTGWIHGTARLLHGFRHEPLALGIGGAALTLLPVMLHVFVRNLPSGYGTSWRFRQSVAVVGLLFAFVLTAIALIALIHEIYWLFHATEPIVKKIGVSWV